jgi:AcrR family transcriptional regulator
MTAAIARLVPPAAMPAKRPRGRPRKTADERDDGNRRRALLLGAARLFRRKGFDATTTRDIAAAASMQSGSPFYHFKSKQALLFAVMEEGMRDALARQRQAMQAGPMAALAPADQLRLLVRNHFGALLGPGSDYIPVMLYEARSLNARQRAALAALRTEYEADWDPVLRALHAAGRLKADVKLARLMLFGALNWSVQWYDRRKGASLDTLTGAALALFIGEPA